VEELASPTSIILQEGRVVALECVRNELGEPGPDGRRRPIPIAGSEFQIEADAIIVAIGQRPDISFLQGSVVTLRKDGTIVAAPETGLAEGGRVYAGGDAVRGPATIVEACADGRRAAEAICHKLGVPFEQPSVHLPVLSEDEIAPIKRSRARKALQHKGVKLPQDQRSDFSLVEATLSEEAALAEAARCLQCSTLCDKCVEVCPNRANYAFFVSPVSLTLPKISCQQGRLIVTGDEVFQVQQMRQIIHIDDFCNECGNCETFCVHHGKPYLDKPRLFLKAEDFELEEDRAFYVQRSLKGWSIRRRERGKEARLSVENGRLEALFETDLLRLEISLDRFQIKSMEAKSDFQQEFSLAEAAEMYIVLRGVSTSLSFLPFEEA